VVTLRDKLEWFEARGCASPSDAWSGVPSNWQRN